MYSKPLFLSSTLTIVMLSLCFTLFGQGPGFSEKFQEANRLDEETELGQSYAKWMELAMEYPDNANVNYKTGRAFLDSYNLKTAALEYLEKAARGQISKNYDPFSPQEKDVPVEVFYYYAKALHLNYELEEAQENYEKFIMASASKHFLYVEAELGTEQVDNAGVLIKVPVNYEIQNLGPVVNTEFPDMSPMVSVDENALFFTSARLRADSSNLGVTDKATGYYFEDIYVSYKNREGKWQRPELLSLNSEDHMASISVSIDGQTLYLYQAKEGNGDIYESRLVGEIWSDPVPLPSVVNTSAWETHLSVSADGKTMYFVSDRKGGLGDRDIYRTRMLPNGKWGSAENLGDVINTKHDEDAVFLSPDGKILYFSSEGHTSMGGFDVFYSKLQADGSWGNPINIGYPINTTDDDLFFVTSADGKRAYFSSERKTGLGQQDIYMINLPDPDEVKLAVLQGTIIPAENESIPEDLMVVVINKGTGEVQRYTPRRRDGTFVAILPPCFDFEVEYMIRGELAAKDTFSIGCESAYQEIYKELLLNPVLLSDGNPIMVESTSGDAQPANFTRYFGYNESNVNIEEAMFANFMKSVKTLSEKQEKVNITILGSASKVPTSTYSDNGELAKLRAENAKNRIMKYAAQFEINVNSLNFTSVIGKVQGPDYNGDAQSNRDMYKKFQYTEVNAK